MAEAGADGLITMAEADAEVAPEAGAPESGASEPPQMQLAGDHYEDEADVMDDVDEVGKVLSKGDYGDNTPSKRRKVASKGVWVWIRRLKNHPALITTGLAQRRTHVCTRPGCWRLINMGYDKKQNCWQTTKGIAHDQLYPAEESKVACAVVQRRQVQGRMMVNRRAHRPHVPMLMRGNTPPTMRSPPH